MPLLGALLAAVLVIAGLTGSADAGADDAARKAPRRVARHVIVVSIDGLKSKTIAQLGRAGTPHLHRMIARGAGTLNARTAFEQTMTLPNHAGMLTGRRINGRTGHRVIGNLDGGRTVHAAAGRYRASLFDVVHDRGGSTALYASKEKFSMFDRTWGPAHGARDRVGRNDGRDKIDKYAYARESGKLVSRVVRELRRGRLANATFLHIRLPDDVGHDRGFASPAYLRAVRRSDRMVGRVMGAMRNGRYRPARVALVVTSDHGGSETSSHRDRAMLANYKVPLLVWAGGAEPGGSLYALNPGRVNPGVGGPGYRRPPIRNTDVASLATGLLGYPAVPGGLLPRTTALRVS